MVYIVVVAWGRGSYRWSTSDDGRSAVHARGSVIYGRNEYKAQWYVLILLAELYVVGCLI